MSGLTDREALYRRLAQAQEDPEVDEALLDDVLQRWKPEPSAGQEVERSETSDAPP